MSIDYDAVIKAWLCAGVTTFTVACVWSWLEDVLSDDDDHDDPTSGAAPTGASYHTGNEPVNS